MKENEEIKADFTIDHEHFKSVQGANVIRLTDGTEFVRKDVASKIMADYVKSKDSDIQTLKNALRNVLKVAKSPTLTTHGMNHLEQAARLLED